MGPENLLFLTQPTPLFEIHITEPVFIPFSDDLKDLMGQFSDYSFDENEKRREEEKYKQNEVEDMRAGNN